MLDFSGLEIKREEKEERKYLLNLSGLEIEREEKEERKYVSEEKVVVLGA